MPRGGRGDRAPQPCIRQIPEDLNHDAVMRIGGEAPRRQDPFSPAALEPWKAGGSLPPRIILALHLAGERDQRQTCVELPYIVFIKVVHVAGRRTAPGGTLPIVT